MRDGKFLVGKVVATSDLKDSIRRSIDLIGGFEEFLKGSDRVTIKPNQNTADPYPASSDPEFIRALGELLLENGASKIQIIESSMFRLKTREIASQTGLGKIAEDLDADLIFLDENDWVKVSFPRGLVMKSGHIGKPLLDIDKLVLAPCLKTHFLAKYTGAMKLLMGWVRGRDRLKMHARNLEAKIPDLASYFSPDLIVMDARTCFVEGGPASGVCSNPGLILASGDMVAIDVEGVRTIQRCDGNNKLDSDVWSIPQIKHAVDVSLGARSDEEILIIDG